MGSVCLSSASKFDLWTLCSSPVVQVQPRMVSLSCCLNCPLPSSDLRQWNLIIKHRVLAGDFEGAVLMFTKMQGSGVHGDNFTFPLMLKAAAGLASSHVGFALHGQMIKTGFSSHVLAQTAMVKLYYAPRYMDRARLLFEKMPEKDLLAWNSMLDAYASYGQMDDALEIFDLMPVGDSVSFNTMISGYGKIGSVASLVMEQ